MENGIPRRSRIIGLAAIVVGLLALLAVAIPQWVMPQPETAPIERHFSLKERLGDLKERLIENLRKIGRKNPRESAEPMGLEQRFPLFAILLALAAVVLATASIVCGEEPFFGGVAVVLGVGAIAFQLTILFGAGVAAILLLYAALGGPDGAVTLAIVAVCAIVVVAALAILGVGPFSTPLLITVAVVILTRSLLAGRSS